MLVYKNVLDIVYRWLKTKKVFGIRMLMKKFVFIVVYAKKFVLR